MKEEINYDVAIVGGGPAGMMAGIFAGRAGASVILVEKNPTLGKKLLISGGGRCNLVNGIFDNRALAKRYGKKGNFLLSPLSQWNAQSTIDFFKSCGCPTKTEAENRVFPKSDMAQSVLDVLEGELKKVGVKILADSPVIKITSSKNIIQTVETSDTIIRAKSFIVTTGGTARPETGSTGDGFKWLAKLGHTIIVPEAALVPVKTAELWSHKLQGLSLTAVKIILFENGTKVQSNTGKILFTHFGLSGPLVLNMSRTIGEVLKNSTASLALDLFPALDQPALDEKLCAHLATAQNKKWHNALAGFAPPLLATALIELSGIDSEIFVNKIPRASRLAFVKLLKNLIITPTGLLPTEKAIVSSGGVALKEVDFKTMRSKKIMNLSLAGDILDFDRPSGGFSLQICWTTGFIAGKNAGVYTGNRKKGIPL
ncbi:MAG: NAD(P)/FAD-dependent oxidoreductase [Candidatus Yonathbacteria bacterium]|nr:NAD(P)/FAD-dependent oxidoreductase [Candidatus Yonathbacteria bacterium]